MFTLILALLPQATASLSLDPTPQRRTPVVRSVAPAPAPTVHTDDLVLNDGTYTVADFLELLETPAPTPTNPSSLPDPRHGGLTPSGAGHPLGSEESVLADVDELALFMPSYGAPSGVAWMREDFRVGQFPLAGTLFDSSAIGQIFDAETGNVDDDPESEVVLLQQFAGSSVVRVVCIDRQPDGSYVWTLLTELAGGSFDASDARLALGDFDADLRDEVAVALNDHHLGSGGQSSWLRVFDDPASGFGEVFFFQPTTGHVALWPRAADLNGDGLDELLVVREGDSVNPGTLWVRVFHGERGVPTFLVDQPQTDWVGLHDGGTTPVGCKLAIGNFDEDLAEEVVFVAMIDGSSPYSPLTPSAMRLRPFEYDAGVWSPIGSGTSFTHTSASTGASLRGNGWDVETVDRFARGRDEVCILRGRSGGNLQLEFFELDVDGWVSTMPVTVAIPRAAQQSSGLELAVGDGDGDGAEDLYFAALEGSASTRPFVYGNLLGGLGTTPVVYSIQNLSISGASRAPVLAPGDFDADGLRVRYTGVTELRVSDPIPLVLLTAAPTKAGIAQNHDASAASYTLSTSSSQAVGVSIGVAASASAGVEVDLLPGLLTASAKATMEVAFARTQTVSEQLTFVQGFSGSYDADVIVFQGPLFRSSEYQILSSHDGTLVGSTFRIDVPLASRTYKWTVDYYNPRVRSEYQLGSTLLPHTIGDPQSYPTSNQMQALVDTYVAWRHPATTAVGQGSGSNQLAIALATESATEDQLDMSLSLEAEFKIGVSTFGVGLTLSTGVMYSLSNSFETLYEGSVGDIGAADYATWSYDFGLAVYQYGRLADAMNRPTGWVPGAYPMTVVAFWTDPTGSGY